MMWVKIPKNGDSNFEQLVNLDSVSSIEVVRGSSRTIVLQAKIAGRNESKSLFEEVIDPPLPPVLTAKVFRLISIGLSQKEAYLDLTQLSPLEVE